MTTREKIRVSQEKHSAHIAGKLIGKVGIPVTLMSDDGTKTPTTTRSEPWQLGHGAWVVLVAGKTGGVDCGAIEV